MDNQNIEILTAALNWRYATKVFDASKKIHAATWSALESSLVLTPTSFGLQPYQFLLVKDEAKRAALLPHSWGQKQMKHRFIICQPRRLANRRRAGFSKVPGLDSSMPVRF